LAVESQQRADGKGVVRTRRSRHRKWWSPFWLWRHRSGRRRRRRFDVSLRRRRRKQRRIAWGVGAAALALAMLGAWAMRDALRIRGHLVAAQATLQRNIDNPAVLRTPEGRAAALIDVDVALVSIDDARRDARASTVLRLLGFVPVLGDQRSGLLDLIDDSAAAATAGRGLLATVDELADKNRLQDGAVPLDSLGELQVRVGAAGQVLGSLTGRSSGLWGPIGDARRRFDDLAGAGSERLTDAAGALGAARTFMGDTGPRRYLVALQNNAEMRDQGAVLSYVVIRFVDGRLTFERRGSVLDLPLDRPVSTVLPPGTREVFGSLAPSQIWQSVNATADFALSGRVMAEMYRQATGQPVDGVIGMDVPALAGLLRALGPVTIDSVAEPISADSVGRMLLHDFYVGLAVTSDAQVRRERLGDVVAAVVARLTSGSHDAIGVGRELGDAAAGGHLRLWSATPAEEEVFERTGLGGGPATESADRTFHLAVQNRTASKLDYFLKPSVHQEIQLTGQGTAVVRTTVTLDNQAPKDARPSYQFGPAGITEKPGDYLGWVLLWGPAGSRQVQGGVVESGLNLSQFVVAVPAGERREVTFETVVPRAVRDRELKLRLVPQARLEPMPLSVTLRSDPRRSVKGSPIAWQGSWDRVHSLAWSFG
jgi:hypothetical protein